MSRRDTRSANTKSAITEAALPYCGRNAWNHTREDQTAHIGSSGLEMASCVFDTDTNRLIRTSADRISALAAERVYYTSDSTRDELAAVV